MNTDAAPGPAAGLADGIGAEPNENALIVPDGTARRICAAIDVRRISPGARKSDRVQVRQRTLSRSLQERFAAPFARTGTARAGGDAETSGGGRGLSWKTPQVAGGQTAPVVAKETRGANLAAMAVAPDAPPKATRRNQGASA